MTTMRSNFFNHLRLMFRPTSISRESALASNYTYVNEDKISRSLICAICLDPLVDPQTHVSCDNSFCNRCITKLRTCPCCRAPILNATDMRPTGHSLRNILDELQVQCNICRQIVQRGQFFSHIRNNCLSQSPITPEQEAVIRESTSNSTNSQTPIDREHIDKHLSNLYRRIHTLENELFELKKNVFISLFFLAAIGTFIFLGIIFSYVITSFMSVMITQWLPSIFQTLWLWLFDFSPWIILFRISMLGIIFLILCYKQRPTNVDLVAIVACSLIILFNLLILISHLLIYHLSKLVFLYMMVAIARFYNVPIPSNEQIIGSMQELVRQISQRPARRSTYR